MDIKDQARLVYQLAERIGWPDDAQAVIRQLEQLRRGLPIEDEFAAMCVWSGRCHVVHQLSQEQFPLNSKSGYQVPDFLALFNVDRATVPALIEVKSTNSTRLKFSASYHRRLSAYADALKLPLLVAWRGKYGIWTVFHIDEMQRRSGGAWHAEFQDVMRQSLMGVLLGDFHISVRAGAGITIRFRMLKQLGAAELEAQVEAAYWHSSDGSEVSNLKGNFLPILFCCPEEVESVEEDGLLTERFFAPTDIGVPAHRTMQAMLAQEGAPDWLHLLRSGALIGGRNAIRAAALDGIDKGMVKYVFDIEPQQRPALLPPRNARATPGRD